MRPELQNVGTPATVVSMTKRTARKISAAVAAATATVIERGWERFAVEMVTNPAFRLMVTGG